LMVGQPMARGHCISPMSHPAGAKPP